MIPKESTFGRSVEVVIPADSHSDDRRDIFVVMNSNAGEFPPGQVKILKMKKSAWLGGQEGHFHEMYPEMYMVIAGVAEFFLQDTASPGIRDHITLEPGERLTIGPGIAHKVFAREGMVMIGLTAFPYRGADQDIPYKVVGGESLS
jgi:mannose-6-phosphate isomerase-like protein (cupin superfamily)